MGRGRKFAESDSGHSALRGGDRVCARLTDSFSHSFARSPGLFHHVGVSAVAGAARLALEHVEVVPLVVAVLEAVGAEAHALADAAGPAAEGHEVGRPDKAAHGRVVELANCGDECKRQEMNL